MELCGVDGFRNDGRYELLQPIEIGDSAGEDRIPTARKAT
jgi:hypothetical protein